MKIEMLLENIKPVSVNAAYATARNGGRFNTKKYNEFMQEFNAKMFPYHKQLSQFDKDFNDKKHGIILEFTFYLPRKRYFTTHGRVNLRSGDASNFIKTTEDALFKKLDTIDDANVISVQSIKAVSYDTNFNIEISIGLVDISELMACSETVSR